MTAIDSELNAAEAAWAAQLRAHGRRVTRQRLAVLGAVGHLPHAVAEDVAAQARTSLPEISLQSVYVILSDLTDLGLLRKIEPPHSPARYETRVDDNHHHVICLQCGRVEDVECVVGHAPCLTPSNTGGMTILVADVLFQGICDDCRTGS